MIGILVPRSKQWRAALYFSRALSGKGMEAERTTDLAKQYDVLVRWGCSSARRCQAPLVEYNPADGISVAAHKYNAILAMARAGVPTPTVLNSEEAMDQEVFPLIGRRGVHYRGRGFWLCLQEQDVANSIADGADYWTPFIPIEREWRVNVFVDDVADLSRSLCYEKMSPMGSSMSNGKGLPLWPWVRNSRNGWTFRKDDEAPVEIRNIAKAAARALGLNIAGVDVAYGNGEYFAIEANTAPGIGENFTANWMANRMRTSLSRRGIIDG